MVCCIFLPTFFPLASPFPLLLHLFLILFILLLSLLLYVFLFLCLSSFLAFSASSLQKNTSTKIMALTVFQLLCNLASWFTFYSITRTLSNSTEAALTPVVLYYWILATQTAGKSNTGAQKYITLRNSAHLWPRVHKNGWLE